MAMDKRINYTFFRCISHAKIVMDLHPVSGNPWFFSPLACPVSPIWYLLANFLQCFASPASELQVFSKSGGNEAGATLDVQLSQQHNEVMKKLLKHESWR